VHPVRALLRDLRGVRDVVHDVCEYVVVGDRVLVDLWGIEGDILDRLCADSPTIVWRGWTLADDVHVTITVNDTPQRRRHREKMEYFRREYEETGQWPTRWRVDQHLQSREALWQVEDAMQSEIMQILNRGQDLRPQLEAAAHRAGLVDVEVERRFDSLARPEYRVTGSVSDELNHTIFQLSRVCAVVTV
jgi:hypothetical protein